MKNKYSLHPKLRAQYSFSGCPRLGVHFPFLEHNQYTKSHSILQLKFLTIYYVEIGGLLTMSESQTWTLHGLPRLIHLI